MRFRRPPPQTIQRFGGSGNQSFASITLQFREGQQGCSSISVGQVAERQRREAVAVEGLWRLVLEIGIAQQLREGAFIDLAHGGEPAILVEGPSDALQAPVVEQRIAGAGVEGDQFAVASDPCHVRHAADVQEGDGPLRQRSGQGPVIDRHKRRALPASGDIGGAHVIDDGAASAAGQCQTVAQSARSTASRAGG